jgi:hypothetical protein
MMYCIERTRSYPPHGCFKIETAARHFHVSVEQLKAYSREGLLIPLKTSRGIHYYTDDDYLWISTIGHLLHESASVFGRHPAATSPAFLLAGPPLRLSK